MEKMSVLNIGNPAKAYILPEEKIGKEMVVKVEPYLQSIVRTGNLPRESGLYYELFPVPDAVGTIVISFGFTEYCVKYHELIYYFLLNRYRVAILEHRGHGKSLREVESPCIVHVEHFDQYVDDLHDFVHSVVIPWAKDLDKAGNRDGIRPKDTPLYLYGHSMGGCIGVRYLECYPKDFRKAVLNAPMLGVNTNGIPPFLAVLLCTFNILFGRGKKRLFSHKDFNPEEPFSHSNGSSETRHNYLREIRRREVLFQTNAASYRWVREAIRNSRKAIRTKEARKVTIPVLLFQAGQDRSVLPGAQREFVERAPNARMVKVPGSRHEIYRSGNQVLGNYLDAIFAFLSEKLA